MKLRRSLNARPESSEGSSASQVQSLVVENRLDDGAGVRATDDHAAVTFVQPSRDPVSTTPDW
jgi:hypothetical protein